MAKGHDVGQGRHSTLHHHRRVNGTELCGEERCSEGPVECGYPGKRVFTIEGSGGKWKRMQGFGGGGLIGHVWLNRGKVGWALTCLALRNMI